jgi:hypothetical protein
VLLTGAGLSLVGPCFAQSGSWRPIANMGETRYLHAATLLNNGNVLVEGGYLNPGAEIFPPRKGIGDRLVV